MNVRSIVEYQDNGSPVIARVDTIKALYDLGISLNARGIGYCVYAADGPTRVLVCEIAADGSVISSI